MRAGAETSRLLGLEMFFVKWARAGSWLRALLLRRPNGVRTGPDPRRHLSRRERSRYRVT